MSSELTPGRVTDLSHGVRRLVAPNPGMMTGPGTNTYIVGTRELAVIDPGPAIAAHIDAIKGAVKASVRWILVTHTHPDHSPAAAILAEACGAQLIGRPAPTTGPQDRTFIPDRVPEDGERIGSGDCELEIVPTPGHASNHLCYRHVGLNWLFTGDHIINGSTVVIDPPDGNMSDYLRSLERLAQLNCTAIAPGHGDVIQEPAKAIEDLIRHRLRREAKAAAAVADSPGATLHELVKVVYSDVNPSLHPLAERSLLAHLDKLAADSRVVRRADCWHGTASPRHS
ncbi:MAG: MBL fold metallo-hydrolase [Woeseia sp.]